MESSVIRTHAIRGWIAAFGGQIYRVLLQFGSTVVLARLVAPVEYGAVAMVASALGFLTLVKDLGLSAATVQKASLSHEESTGLFWANIAIGSVLMLVTAACAPLVAHFYNRPELYPIVLAFAAMAPISSLGAQHAALLQRNLQFASLAVRDIAAVTGGTAVGIALAYMGEGVWALVCMQLATVAFGTITVWIKSPWRPGTPKWNKNLVPLLKFGGHMSTANLLAYANHNLDSILLGRFFGAHEVGIYTRAHALLLRPISAMLPSLVQVAFPVLSRLHTNPMEFSRALVCLTGIMCFVGGLIVTPIIPCADWIVRLMLGDPWMQATPLVIALAPFMLLEPVSYLMGQALIASGNPGLFARWRGITMIAVVAGFLVGLNWGPLGVAISYSFTGLATRAWLFATVSRSTAVSSRQLFAAAGPFLMGSLVATALAVVGRIMWTPQTAIAGIISYGFISITAYLGIAAAFPSSRRLIIRAFDLVRQSLRPSASTIGTNLHAKASPLSNSSQPL